MQQMITTPRSPEEHLSNKRKPHPIARPHVVNEAADAALARLRKTHSANAEVMVVFGGVGLVIGRKQEKEIKFARDVRARLAKLETATRDMPVLLDDADWREGILKSDAGLGRLLDAFGARVRELHSLCGTLIQQLSGDSFKQSSGLSSQPEVAMAAWASCGPVFMGDRTEPVPLATNVLMDLAIIIGVDSPTESRISRKSRWENRSRKSNIGSAVGALMKGHAATPDSLTAQLLDHLPNGSFRDEVADRLAAQMGKVHGGGGGEIAPHIVVPVVSGFTADEVLQLAKSRRGELAQPVRLVLSVDDGVAVVPETVAELLKIIFGLGPALSDAAIVSRRGLLHAFAPIVAKAARDGAGIAVEAFVSVERALRWSGRPIAPATAEQSPNLPESGAPGGVESK